MKVAKVLLPLPLADVYDYRLPAFAVALGDYVEVPFGRRHLLGVVWELAESELNETRLKTIVSRRDLPPMADDLRRFIDWVAAYTVSPRGAVLKLAMSADSAQEAVERRHYICASPLPEIKMTPTRRRVLALATLPQSKAMLAEAAACSGAVVEGLIKAGALLPVAVKEATPPLPDLTQPGPILSPSQAAAAEVLQARVRGGFSVALLEGVTGSGKTEVYAHAVREALAVGAQVLVLVPEIALSLQMMERFTKLFGVPPLLWHSDLPGSMRQRTWRQVASGHAKLVVGARSALFLPFARLGLVVVDEEHDSSYKQEDGVSYHARDMAVVRAQLLQKPAVLVSATPALETIFNVREGKYGHVTLPDRFAGAVLPEVKLIDLLKQPPPRGRWLAPPVVTALTQTLEKSQQSLLFLNRRGYAPLTLCRACGYRFLCPNCSAWLVEHRGRGATRLECHHCGHRERLPEACPKCAETDSFAACGPGVERLEEEARELFPTARIAVLTSELNQNWRALQEVLQRIEKKEIDIIIGTQIMAKGHHFPGLATVVIVDADLGLDGGDVRARERVYQLLEQVSGRAGRAEHAGTVLLQSQFVTNFIFAALAKNDRAGFVEHELHERESHHWPPYARLAALVVEGRDSAKAESCAHEIRRKSCFPDGVEIFGPAPAPMSKLRGMFRYRLLIRAPRQVKLQPLVADLLSRIKPPRGVDIQIVIDPFTFL